MDKLSPKMVSTLRAVMELAHRDLAYMPTQIGDRSACAALMRRGLLESKFAQHEETMAEGFAYVLALCPAFNAVAGFLLLTVEQLTGLPFLRRW